MATLYKLGQTLRGSQDIYRLTKEIHKTVWLASNSRGETVVVKGVRHSRIKNECDVLRKFQARVAIRLLIDEIVKSVDPPGIALRYLEDDLLAASSIKTLNRSEIKQVSRIVLETLVVLHEDGYAHTGRDNLATFNEYKSRYLSDIKPNNILCNYKRDWESDQGNSSTRFSEVRVADFESCVPSSSDHASQGDPIGASMFRSPEANIWSFGAMVSVPSPNEERANDAVLQLMNLFFGNYHIFNPRVPFDDLNYDRIVLERMHMFFGPFPLTYKALADTETLQYLADVMSCVPQRKPFHLVKDKEFEPEDKTFLVKIMKLDPRD